MKELVGTIIDTTKDRIKNPFIGTFLIAWIFFNWKPLIYLIFSKVNIEKKLTVIDSEYLSIGNQLLLPFGFALFYVIIIPYLMWLFDFLSNKAIIGRKENVVNQNLFDIKSSQRLAQEESVLENIRARYKEQADLNKLINSQDQKIKILQKTVEEFEEENNSLKEKQLQMSEIINRSNSKELSDEERDKLNNSYEKFKESDLFEFFQDIGSEISRYNRFPHNTDNLLIEKYIHSNLVVEKVNEVTNNSYYEFTKTGLYFWKQYVMGLKFKKKEQLTTDDLPF